MPLHTLIKLTPIAYGCETTYYQFITDENSENKGHIAERENRPQLSFQRTP
uniref:Transposase n=1 Tax=Ascaris lumbricoides TaxID=6252 RepID=A0A0M3HME9_ASCLU